MRRGVSLREEPWPGERLVRLARTQVWVWGHIHWLDFSEKKLSMNRERSSFLVLPSIGLPITLHPPTKDH